MVIFDLIILLINCIYLVNVIIILNTKYYGDQATLSSMNKSRIACCRINLKILASF